jgi:hypothetical protein
MTDRGLLVVDDIQQVGPRALLCPHQNVMASAAILCTCTPNQVVRFLSLVVCVWGTLGSLPGGIALSKTRIRLLNVGGTWSRDI